MEEIKAGDIMLNNWFHVNGYPMYVDSIFRDTVYLEFEGNEGDVWEENIKDLKPIQLTEDILVKAGFEELYKSKYTRKLEHKVYFFIEWIERPYQKCIYYNNHPFEHIKYLHQLQNLFKSLTGTDLKIDL